MNSLTFVDYTLGLLVAAILFAFVLCSHLEAKEARGTGYSVTLPVADITIPKLKAALRMVENTPRQVIGHSHERSEYQLTQDVWKMWTFEPFELASKDTPEATRIIEEVVSKHLAWIKACIEKQGYTLTPYSIACVWKAGLGRWTAYKLRKVDRQYAERFENLYLELHTK